jgi:hypothetical protein
MTVKQIEPLLMDYVTSHQDLAGSYLHSTMKAVKSWLLSNDIELRHKIQIRGLYETPSLTDERIPSKEELRRILLSATKQSRVAVALMAFGGLRPQVLGDYTGRDGLRIGDLPELKVTATQIEFENIPTRVVVRSNLSKARHQYFTFLGEEACQYVVDYLNERGRQGEDLTAESPVIRPRFLSSEKKEKMNLSKKFIRTTNVGDMVRVAIRHAGFRWRPYVLRCFFDTQLMLAESKGFILRDYRSFLMGHKGDIEHRYTIGKNRLPENVIDDMRASYDRSESFLQTIEPEIGKDNIKMMFKKELLLVSGFGEEEISKLDLSNTNDEKLHLLMKQRLLGVMNSNRQQVVALVEVQDFIQRGWEYVTALPDRRAVIKFPS